MVQKNYWRWLKAITEYNVGYEAASVDIGLVGIDGVSAPMYLGGSVLDRIQRSAGLNRMLTINIICRLGAGTTTITADDYALTNDITDNLSNVTYTYTQSSDNNVTRTMTITGMNNSGEEVTITQAAYCKRIYATDNPNTAYNTVMFAAVTLTDPITVSNGDSFTITLEWIEA